jgi:hypothetical protein
VPRVACLDLGQVVHVQDDVHVMFMLCSRLSSCHD